jgi:hypothetical protein
MPATHAASLRYGITAKAQAIRQVLQLKEDEWPDQRLHGELRKRDYDVERVIDAWMQHGPPNDNIRATARLNSDDEPEIEASSKRPRSPELPPEAGPSMMDTEPCFVGEVGVGQTGVLAMTLLQMKGQLDTLLSGKFVSDLAKAVPQAVRDYDEQLAAKQREEAKEHGFNAILAQIQLAGTVEQLGKLDGWTFNGAENILICNDCNHYSTSPQVPTTLKYAHGSGIIQGPHRTRPLSTVKFWLKRHILSGIHEWCTCHAAEVARSQRIATSAGVNCAKLVLSNIHEHDTDSSYERRITTMKSMGLDMGTKNHSRFFVPDLRTAMYDTLIGGFTKVLTEPDPITKRPRPFALLSDKATVNRETGQMHGLISMIEGEFTALFLSVLPSPDPSGLGLSHLLRECLCGGKPFRFSPALVRLSLSCLAFDGQYQSEEEGHASGLQVRGHLCQLMGLEPAWVSSRWDYAHRIELGIDTVRDSDDADLRFYKILSSVVAQANSKYLYGKGYERVQATALRLGSKLRGVGSVCTTRFCASERKVYKNFIVNIPAFVFDMEGPRAGEVGVLTQRNLIGSVTFVVELCGVIDLLAHIKVLSLKMQMVNTLPWENEEVVEAFLNELDLIATGHSLLTLTLTLARPNPNPNPILQILRMATRAGRCRQIPSPRGSRSLCLSSSRRTFTRFAHGSSLRSWIAQGQCIALSLCLQVRCGRREASRLTTGSSAAVLSARARMERMLPGR